MIIIDNIKSSETLWITYTHKGIPIYYVTSNKERTKYYLYEINKEGAKKIKTDTSPNFDEYIVYKE